MVECSTDDLNKEHNACMKVYVAMYDVKNGRPKIGNFLDYHWNELFENFNSIMAQWPLFEWDSNEVLKVDQGVNNDKVYLL